MLIADTPYPLNVSYLETAAGIQVAYTEEGQGFSLLLLHGLGSYLPAWQKNLPYLSKHFRCLALDLPGFGKSSKEGFTPGMTFYAGIVNEFLERLEIGKCYLAGHSMGGQVAIHTALRYPQKVLKLALLAPAGIETFSPAEVLHMKEWFSVEKLLHAPLSSVEKNVRANFHAFPEDAQVLLKDRLQYTRCTDYLLFCQTLSACVSAMVQEPVYEQLPELQMPVLLLFGLQDRYIPSPLLHPQLSLKRMASSAADQIPEVQLYFIDQCGHFIQWEQPEQVNKLLLNFFGDESKAAGFPEFH